MVSPGLMLSTACWRVSQGWAWLPGFMSLPEAATYNVFARAALHRPREAPKTNRESSNLFIAIHHLHFVAEGRGHQIGEEKIYLPQHNGPNLRVGQEKNCFEGQEPRRTRPCRPPVHC